jgi:hypothetical protein
MKTPREKEWWIEFEKHSFGIITKGNECRILGVDDGIVKFSRLIQKPNIEHGFGLEVCNYYMDEFLENFRYCKSQEHKSVLNFIIDSYRKVLILDLDNPSKRRIIEYRLNV